MKNCKTSIFNWSNDGVIDAYGVCVKTPEQCGNQMPSYSSEASYRNPMQSQYPIRQNGGSGSVTPYSPYIWRQQGSYPAAVGGGRRRKKGTKAKKSRKSKKSRRTRRKH